MFTSSSDPLPAVIESEQQQPVPPGLQINVWRMIRRRWLLMITVFALVAIPGLAAVYHFVPPVYTASADVRFAAITPRIMNTDHENNGSIPYEKFLNTQVSLITDNAILSKVMERPEVRALPVIQAQEDPLSFLKNRIKAEVEHDSELIRISCKLPDRDAAKSLVDATLAAYMDYASAQDANIGGERLRALRAEETTHQQDLDAQLKHMSELQQQLGMPVVAASDLGSRDVDSYRDLQAKAEADAAREASRKELLESQVARLEQLQADYKRNSEKPIPDFGIEQSVAADARVEGARKESMQLEATVAQVSKHYSDTSPQLEVDRENLKSLHARAAGTEATVRGEMLANALASHREELDSAKKLIEDAETRIERFTDLIKQQQERAVAVSKTLAELDETRTRADETRNLLKNVRDEITAIGVESNAPARVTLASDTHVPLLPEKGRQLQMAFLVLVFACGTAVGLAWLLERTDKGIYSIEDVVAITAKPVLAAIPHAAAEQIPLSGPPASIVAEFPDTVTANEYRKLMASVTFYDPDFIEARSCLITSPATGDGKTSVACNLAMTLAEASRRVLLIDTSPLAGGVEEHFEMAPAPGLSEILFSGQPLTTLARETKFQNLFVLGPGLRLGRLSASLGARAMRELIVAAEKDYDQVLIVCPASLERSDARLLASTVDGVLVVAGARTSTTDTVRRVVAELEQAGGYILGVVLNGLGPMKGRTLGAMLARRQSDSSPNGKSAARRGGRGMLRLEGPESPAYKDKTNPAIKLPVH